MATIILFISVWIHVLSAITWLGSMIAMEFIILSSIKKDDSFTNGQILSSMSKNFARLSETASGLIFITGIYQVYADKYLDVNKLLSTTFGNLVLLKVILFFVFAGLGVAASLKITKLDSTLSRENLESALRKANMFFALDIVIGIVIILISIALRFDATIPL